jgi:hypothetical protein
MRSLSLMGLTVVSAAAAFACGSAATKGGFAVTDAGGDGQIPTGDDSGTSSGGNGDGSGIITGDGGTMPHESGAPTPVALVYAHSADTLYRMDPTSNQIAVVGPFSGGCDQSINLAIDESSNAYVTTQTDLWHLDLQTAACTHIASGSYPNSLSFVPKETLDPNVEALVGYVGSTYIRIDTTTGAITTIGGLSGSYSSSGDIVSVIGGGTFLTVKGGPQGSCGDCLLQIDPKTGDLVQSYGSVNHADVFGLAFWAGTAYGFDNGGDVFSIGWQNGTLTTTAIAVPNPPPNLSFWGAGSTTAAPPTAADGGGIPIQ